jgi:hypothetical protein
MGSKELITPNKTNMKLPDEVIAEILHVITDEELIRFGVRLRKRDGILLRKQARKHLQELLLTEQKRRETTK